MRLLYLISIALYSAFIHFASIFNSKARLFVRGRKSWQKRLKDSYKKNGKTIWFHCASLGEFEQGRPVMENIRKSNPEINIVLTFFSPSGYEIRKNYDGADLVCYLPMDFPVKARKFIDIIQPDIAVFVKYEFWFSYIRALSKKSVPLVYISAIFRKDQHFFKWYGRWQSRQLEKVNHFFVQNEVSAELLSSLNIERFTVAGDTRFDRVFEVSKKAEKFPDIERFVNGKKIFLAGSSWPQDEAVIFPLINEFGSEMKFLFAPHEVHDAHIEEMLKHLPESALRYSEADQKKLSNATVLIIDSIGILLHLYQYAHIAFIGGGFGKGIHNILEAATFGVPVLFGPNYGKFQEAHELLEAGAARLIKDQNDLRKQINCFLNDHDFKKASEICSKYVESRKGATGMIVTHLQNLLNDNTQ